MGKKMSFFCWERFKSALKNDVWKKKKNTIGPEKPGPIRANKGQCEKKNSQVQKSVPKGWKCNQMIEKNFFQVGKCSKMKKKMA
mmetsp:Transcript_31692/g.40690  ORF Transcript_31692/g.40690 Transcript_31692/m.40690 type:complete len:84 (+) Transcript_31692:224-475(+)